MDGFTDTEARYLESQKLARLATVGADGAPHIAPITFSFDQAAATIAIGGFNLEKSKKWSDIEVNPTVSIVIDDVVAPWKPRGIEVRGQATREGTGDSARIVITAGKVIEWGLDGDPYVRNTRSIKRED